MNTRFEPLVKCHGTDPETGDDCQSLIDNTRFDRCTVCREQGSKPERRYRPERESPVRNALPPTNGLDVDQRSGVITSTKKQRTTNDR